MPERAPLDYERVTPPPRRSHSSLWRMLIVFALLIIIILGFDVLWLTPTHRRSAESAYQANCSNNLRQIGLAIQTYADGNSLQFPTELGALILLALRQTRWYLRSPYHRLWSARG